MLDKLVAIQTREALTDAQMGARMGLTRTHWNLVRNGHRALTHQTALRAAGAFPELTRDLIDMAAAIVDPDGLTAAGHGRAA